MTSFDKNIIKQLLSFGFKLHKCESTDVGTVNEYKYYPTYLDASHYTLVLFESHFSGSCDHRLYIHSNTNGSFVSGLYQVASSTEGGRNFINNKISEIFVSEMRISTINEILS